MSDSAPDTDRITERNDTRGAFIGTGFGQEDVYENDLIREIENADSSVTIRVMKNGLSIPKSVLAKAQEQGKKLIIEIFQPGYDAAMFNSRWVFDPSRVHWTLDQDEYELGINLDLDSPYHSRNPNAASHPVSSIVGSDSTQWAVYDMPELDGSEGETLPGFYVEVDHWGEFDGLSTMPLYNYSNEAGALYPWGSAVRGDDAVVSDTITWPTVRIDNPCWGAHYAVLSEEHNYLPAEEIETQITASDTEEIDLQLGACFLDNQYVLPAKTLDMLRDSGKTLTLNFMGVEAQPAYSWTFDGSRITDTTDIDLFVLFSYSVYNELPIELLPSGDIPMILFDFAHSGLVPDGTSISVTAPSEYLGSGYLYYVNEENGTLDYIGRTSSAMQNEYFCTLSVSGITHCSRYLVSAQELTGDNIVMPEDPSEPQEPADPQKPSEPDTAPSTDAPQKPSKENTSVDKTVSEDPQKNSAQVNSQSSGKAAVKTGDSSPVLWAGAASPGFSVNIHSSPSEVRQGHRKFSARRPPESPDSVL